MKKKLIIWSITYFLSIILMLFSGIWFMSASIKNLKNKSILEEYADFIDAGKEYNDLSRRGKIDVTPREYFTIKQYDTSHLILIDNMEGNSDNKLKGFVNLSDYDFVYIFPDKEYFFGGGLTVEVKCSDSIYKPIDFSDYSSRAYKSNVNAILEPKDRLLRIDLEPLTDEYEFTMTSLEDGSWGYELTRVYDNGTYVYNIPNSYKGLPVISIGAYAFESATKINSVSIPESVRHIGVVAFDCDNFTSNSDMKIVNGWLLSYYKNSYDLSSLPIKGIADGVLSSRYIPDLKLPNTLRFIGRKSFSNSSLETLRIPDSVEFIGDYAFEYSVVNYKTPTIVDGWLLNSDVVSGSVSNDVIGIAHNDFADSYVHNTFTVPSKLKFISTAYLYHLVNSSFAVDESNTYFSVESGCLYNKDKTVLLKYPCLKKDTSFVTPSSVSVIASSSFHGSENLKSLTLREVVLAESYSISGSEIIDIRFGNKIQSINPYFASNNYDLKSIIIDPDAPLEKLFINSIESSELELLVLPKNLKKIINDGYYYGYGIYTEVTLYLTTTKLLDINGLGYFNCCYLPDSETLEVYNKVYKNQGFYFDFGTYS